MTCCMGKINKFLPRHADDLGDARRAQDQDRRSLGRLKPPKRTDAVTATSFQWLKRQRFVRIPDQQRICASRDCACAIRGDHPRIARKTRHPGYGSSAAFPRFESYRRINQPRPEERARAASLRSLRSSTAVRASRRTATSETEPAAILRDGASRLLRPYVPFLRGATHPRCGMRGLPG